MSGRLGPTGARVIAHFPSRPTCVEGDFDTVLDEPHFRVGLFDNLEFDLISDNLLWSRDEDLRTHQADETSGAGDTTLRLKLNLWGNDNGKSAFGLCQDQD